MKKNRTREEILAHREKLSSDLFALYTLQKKMQEDTDKLPKPSPIVRGNEFLHALLQRI